MRPTAQHREVLRYLREDYGVADAALANGTNHPRIEFTYAGERRTLTVHGPGDNHRSLGGNNLIHMKKQDIRRLLGPPPERATVDNKRKLEDMMPPFNAPRIVSSTGPVEPAQDIYHGHAAVYTNGPMRFFVPTALAETFFDVGMRAAPFGDCTWKISRDPLSKNHVSRRLCRAGEHELNAPVSTETFGISPVEYYRNGDDDILAYVPLATRMPLKKVKLHARGAVEAPTAAPQSASAPVPAMQQLGSETDHMRECLAIIRRVEADTPFRLVRGKESGIWRFVASVE